MILNLQQSRSQMTTDKTGGTGNRFVLTKLPWLIGAGGMLVYCLTLNHWISFASLGTVAWSSGWIWRPELEQPLSRAVSFPFRVLPAAWIPLALNLFTAGGAGLVLVLLARSVALLRQDILPKSAFKQNAWDSILSTPTAWIPPVLAALGCGLQLGFWENATSATGAMISLLCFAYAIRCLLEFRLTQEQFWLSRCAWVYAAGMANDWVMVGYFPVVLAAIIWVKGITPFLDPRFLLRMTGWGLVDLSVYLWLPTLLSRSGDEPLNFWLALKTHLQSQRHALRLMQSPVFRLLIITGLLPFLILAVRWTSHTVQFADDTRLGIFLAKATGHFIHGLFLLTSLWIVFEPAIIPRQLELRSSLLIYNFTWAMVTGYCAGYLLLFGRPRGSRRPAKWPAFAALCLVGLLPTTLIWKNLGAIQLTNGRAFREFARQLYDDLPVGKVAVLSDEPRPLLLLRAELGAHGGEKNPMLIDTHSLPWPGYHRRLARDYASRWPEPPPTNHVDSYDPAQMLAFIRQVATNEPVVYLHPSSGFFFEDFAAEPHGWIQRLAPRQHEPPAIRVTTAEAENDNEQVWQQRWTGQLASRVAQFEASRKRVARWSRPPLKSLRLSSRENDTATMLAGVYAKALNHWGVQAARRGRAAAATEWFQRAIAFDPENLAARINLEFATRRQKGEPSRLTLAWTRDAFANVLGKYESWVEVISRCGPVDEPTFLLQSGRMYLDAGQLHQALAAFARCAELAPDWVAPKLGQAQSQNRLGNFAAALALTEGLPAAPLDGPALAQLLLIRTVALRRTGQTNEAVAYLDQFASTHQQANEVLVTAADLCATAGLFPAELKWRGLLLQRDPNRVDWLVKQGLAELRQGELKVAMLTLTRALTLLPTDDNARLFRAIAALQSGRFDDARRDYQELLKKPDFSQSALFGLGGIAWRERDTNALIQYYQTFLSNSTALTPRAAVASQRLKAWQDE